MGVAPVARVPVRFLAGAEVLDLFARVADFGEAQGGGGALEEVAERGEGGEVFVFAGGGKRGRGREVSLKSCASR